MSKRCRRRRKRRSKLQLWNSQEYSSLCLVRLRLTQELKLREELAGMCCEIATPDWQRVAAYTVLRNIKNCSNRQVKRPQQRQLLMIAWIGLIPCSNWLAMSTSQWLWALCKLTMTQIELDKAAVIWGSQMFRCSIATRNLILSSIQGKRNTI